MKKYKVNSNIKHDGKLYKENDIIVLPQDQAEILLIDKIIVDENEKVSKNKEKAIQPEINIIKREGDNSKGKGKIEKPETENPQIGGDEKRDYKVLKGLEFPKGVVHKKDSTISLTDEEAEKFAKGLIEEIAEEDNL